MGVSQQAGQRRHFVQPRRDQLLRFRGAAPRGSIRDTASSMNAHCSSACAVGAFDAARQQVEQHLLVELAGGRAVLGAHAVGVDLELRPRGGLGAAAREQRLQRLVGVGVVRVLAHDHLAVEGELAALGGDAAEQLARHGVGRRVLDLGEHVVRLDAVGDAGGGELAARAAARELDEQRGARGEAAERHACAGDSARARRRARPACRSTGGASAQFCTRHVIDAARRRAAPMSTAALTTESASPLR